MEAEAGELLEESAGVADFARNGERAGVDEGVEIGEEGAARDAPEGMLFGDTVAGSDHDGELGSGKVESLEEVVDGEPGTTGVDDEGGLAVESGLSDKVANMLGDGGVGSTEREAVDMAKGEDFFSNEFEADRVAVVVDDGGGFEDNEGGMVLLVAEVEAEEEMGRVLGRHG